MKAGAQQPGFWDLFTPKIVTVFQERYRLVDFRADVLAGLTVAIVAIPLSMAIAIASGVTPDRGLYTAIVGGFMVSLLSGSRFQIGGPAGAFIVLVGATVAEHGIDGLILATLLSGLILLCMGFLRFGTYIKYIPYPVTVGFTAGIAVIIFASQIKDLLGLHLTAAEPAELLPKLVMLGGALPSVSAPTLAISLSTIAIILMIRRFRPHWPSLLIAVVIASLATWFLALPVVTIGTRFGGIPHGLPAPGLPPLSFAKITEVLPAAFSFAVLGSIESLLSAVVADSMTGRRHRSNCELVAQGAANIASALFGGICVTGAIARTATNVRSGARGPVAGMLHALFVLLFMIVAAPLASYIPLSALAGVLAVVAWNMAERHAFATLIRATRGDALVLLATFLLTIFRDLMTGIAVGFGLAALLFLHRMAEAVEIESGHPMSDEEDGAEMPYDASVATDPDVIVYRISGAFFFGAAVAVTTVLENIAEHPKAYVIDLSAVPLLDSTAAASLEGFVRKARRHDVAIYVTGTQAHLRKILQVHGVRAPDVTFLSDVDEAIAAAHAALAPLPPKMVLSQF